MVGYRKQGFWGFRGLVYASLNSGHVTRTAVNKKENYQI